MGLSRYLVMANTTTGAIATKECQQQPVDLPHMPVVEQVKNAGAQCFSARRREKEKDFDIPKGEQIDDVETHQSRSTREWGVD